MKSILQIIFLSIFLIGAFYTGKNYSQEKHEVEKAQSLIGLEKTKNQLEDCKIESLFYHQKIDSLTQTLLFKNTKIDSLERKLLLYQQKKPISK